MKTTTLTHNSYILGVFPPLVSCYESQLTWKAELWTGQAWVVAAWPCTEDTVPVCAGEAAGGRRARHEFFIAIDCRCTVATLLSHTHGNTVGDFVFYTLN